MNPIWIAFDDDGPFIGAVIYDANVLNYEEEVPFYPEYEEME